MRRLLLSLAAGVLAIGALALAATPAQAGDKDRWWRRDHGRYHDELEHRDFHRRLEHRDAHRYPMTWWEHEQLHDALRHDRFHDRLEHRDYHRWSRPAPDYYSPYGSYYYAPYPGYGGYGIGVQGRNFSFWLGR